METEAGDDYIRRLASFIRTNEKGLAESAFLRRRARSSPSTFPWPLSTSCKPIVLSTDTHHLFYILVRLEALGFRVGPLDIPVLSPSRPMSYLHIYSAKKNSETLSLASFHSTLSLVSKFSLRRDWWPAYNPSSIEGELKYIYSSFTKIPALSICAPRQKIIAELSEDSALQNAVPLDIFKNIQRLECEDIDPRVIIGWDRLADSLRSLKIRRSGLDDISQIFLVAAIQDHARRHELKPLPEQLQSTPTQHPITLPPESYHVDDEHERLEFKDGTDSVSSASLLPFSKWSFLKHLFLPENSLTSFPSELLPYLTSLSHLDLSSNLLVSVPPGLAELSDLVGLNLADNLIDSVQNIFLSLGQVLYLNLAKNRLESLCGLDRLFALERIDLRHNLLEDSLEIGRLTALPNLSELWVEGNPFVELEEDYRIACFSYFSKEGKEIRLDDRLPSLYEKRNLALPDQFPRVIAQSTSSAPVISIEHPRPSKTQPLGEVSFVPSDGPSFSVTSNGEGQKRKKLRRVVDLEENDGDHEPHLSLRNNAKAEGIPQTHFNRSLFKNVGESRGHDHALSKQREEIWVPPDASVTSPSPGWQHSRHRTDYANTTPTSFFGNVENVISADKGFGASSSALQLKSEKRQNRVSASFFEPSAMRTKSDASMDNSMDTYRKRIELLKRDMGESWLKVYSQSH